jgi:hypothetical protein
VTTRTGQGMARVRPGQALAPPLSSGRTSRSGSAVKDAGGAFFCEETSRSESLTVEGRLRALGGPLPDLGLNQRPLT